MSDNPFNAPNDPGDVMPPSDLQSSDQSSDKPSATPGGLMAICVICLAFGFLGSSGSCFGGVASLFQGSFSEFLLSLLPDQPEFEAQKELTRDILTINSAAQKPVMIPQLILYALKLVIGVMMFVGAIGCFSRKEGARRLLRTSLAGACICGVFAIILGIYSVLVVPPAFTAELSNFADNANFSDLESSVTQTVVTQYIAIGIGIPIGLGVIAFYWWSRRYLNRSNIVQLFS